MKNRLLLKITELIIARYPSQNLVQHGLQNAFLLKDKMSPEPVKSKRHSACTWIHRNRRINNYANIDYSTLSCMSTQETMHIHEHANCWPSQWHKYLSQMLTVIITVKLCSFMMTTFSVVECR